MEEKIFPIIKGKKVTNPKRLAKVSENVFTININIPLELKKQFQILDTLNKKRIYKFMRYLMLNKKELISLAVKSTGTPRKYHEEDYRYIIHFLRNYNYKPMDGLRPKGNVLISLSANEPFILSIIPIINALSAGNSIFINPSSKNLHFVYQMILFLISSNIFKKEKINLFYLEKNSSSEFFKKNIFNCVYWFGSSETISKVSASIDQRYTEIIPESEGNDFFYLDASSKDLPKTAKVIISGFIRHNGQMCNSIRVLLVDSKIYNYFIEILKKEFIKITKGNPNLKKTDYSTAAVNKTPQEILDIFLKKVKTKNTRIISLKENLLPIMIINPKKETIDVPFFDSLLLVKKINNLQEVLDFSNNSRYGVSFTIFSENIKKVNQLVKSLNYARINVNMDPLKINSDEPWGGVGRSGNGGAEKWIVKFSNKQFIKRK